MTAETPTGLGGHAPIAEAVDRWENEGGPGPAKPAPVPIASTALRGPHQIDERTIMKSILESLAAEATRAALATGDNSEAANDNAPRATSETSMSNDPSAKLSPTHA